MVRKISPHQVLSSPEWFLGGIDYPNRGLIYFKTTQALLGDAAFHDGRTPLHSSSDILTLSLDDALNWYSGRPPLSGTSSGNDLSRIIAHTSFCGSTLLARALENHGHVMSYREPQIFVQLANIKSLNPSVSHSLEWGRLLEFVFGQFQIPWTDDEITIVKPSNWANTILVDFAKTEMPLHAVILTMDLDAYLVANIRGGKPRLGFSIDLLNHLIREKPQYRQDVNSVQSMNLPPMQQVLYFLAICYGIQHDILDAFDAQWTHGAMLRLYKTDLINNKENTLPSVAQSLSFNLSKESLKKAETAFARNSKSHTTKTYNPKEELSQNSKIQIDYKSDIEEVCLWHSETFKRRVPEF